MSGALGLACLEKNEMIDFERTHRLRRAICQALQQGQKLESHITERSEQIAVAGKRDLLLLLSNWLLELNPASATSEAKFRELQSLTQASFEGWIHLQAAAVQNEKDLREAEDKLREAEGAFKKKAPFGAATKLLAGAESKSQIRALDSNRETARRHRESLSRAIEVNVKNRQTLAEIFFRDCLKQREKLATTQALGKEAGAILDRMNQETNAIWVGHLKQQTEEIDRVAKHIEGLRECYKDAPVSPPQPHKTSSLQEQSEVHLGQGNSYDFTE